jgi:DNA helicase-2/ATP-dependent DNA helicase PcrA
LHFDLFAAQTVRLLSKSKKLAAILSDAYPLIILDEFQDTNAEEWELIQILGAKSRLIALADAEQRIYEFRGADPKRIGEFIAAFQPAQFDFGTENNRSNGTDIAVFGNDLLTGANKSKSYANVSVAKYQVKANISRHSDLKIEVIKGCQRLVKSGNTDWSLAVLVPTRQLILDVSDYLSEAQQFSGGGKLPTVPHEVALETTGPSLAAVLVAGLLEGSTTSHETAHRMISDLCGHMRGRSDSVAQAELQLAGALVSYAGTGKIRGPKRKLVVEECIRIAKERHTLALTGDPWQDWLTIRQMLADSSAAQIQKVAEDAKYLRLLHKGALLRSKMSELWRENGHYSGAASVVREALLQEHFSASVKQWRGVHVMTIHKAKGKEFDETIIYEGAYQGRIVRAGADERGAAQARLALRVAVTRAMKHATILTPRHDVCPFL